MGDEIKTVYGTQKSIRLAIAALVAAHKPVFDVQTKRAGIFWHVATIRTAKAQGTVLD